MRDFIRSFREKITSSKMAHPGLQMFKTICLLLVVIFFIFGCVFTTGYLTRYSSNPVFNYGSPKEEAAIPSPNAVVFTGETGDPHNVVGIQAYFSSYENGVLTLDICSINNLDAWLVSIQDGGTLQYWFASDICLPAFTDEIVYDSFSFENVDTSFVTNLAKATITYKYDDGVERSVPIFPYAQSNEAVYNSTLIRTQDNTDQFSFITTTDDAVQFEGQNITINTPLFIPAGKQFRLTPGQTIDLINGAFIVARCPIIAPGTTDSAIRFFSSDGTGKGIFVCQATSESEFSYVTFDGLDTPKSGIWGLTGSVTFYESDVSIDHCAFINNICEDALNIVRSEFSINASTFENIFADAFDSDFSNGTITGCVFRNTGNDGVDVSTSHVTVSDTNFYDIGDKGVSGGEHSVLTISNIIVDKANIGLASKDLSFISGSDINVRNVTIGIALYQKKPEYGPATIDIDNFALTGLVSLDYLIQKGSNLYIDNEYVEPKYTVKINMLIEKIINEEPIQ